jgi:hypothetical protein
LNPVATHHGAFSSIFNIPNMVNKKQTLFARLEMTIQCDCYAWVKILFFSYCIPHDLTRRCSAAASLTPRGDQRLPTIVGPRAALP